MKFNTFYLCYVVWGVASALSIFLSIWKNHKLKRVHSIQLIYLRQFILLAQSGKTSKDIIRELYYFFVADKVMRKILLRAMNMPNTKGLDYIQKKIGCEPMKILHGFLIKREGQTRNSPLPSIPKDIIQYFNDSVEQWDGDYIEIQCQKRKNKLKGVSEILAFMLLNYYIYSWLRTDLSLWIFAIVNTVGVIFFIILGNEKTHTSARGIRGLYHLVSGMGLIVNIFTIVSGWLGQIA